MATGVGKACGAAFKKVLKKGDKRLCRQVFMRAVKGVLKGESWDDIETSLTDFAEPKAVDWNAILAFIQALQPIIQEMLDNCNA